MLVVGWPSLIDGVATAGDVLAMEVARDKLDEAGVACDVAWSPAFRPGALRLEDADPDRYTHLVFACGPLHGPQIAALHHRYRRCRRVAIGVSVMSADDPAVTGFDAVLPRDSPWSPTEADLSVCLRNEPVPLIGLALVAPQAEYGGRGRHDQVADGLMQWLRGQNCARLEIDTRLATDDWTHCTTAAELESVIRHVDLVVTMRLHGLVLALKTGVPALAVDPVAGGAKVAAQAAAWSWPAVVTVDDDGRLDREALDRWRDWCLSVEGVRSALRACESPPRAPLGRLLAAMDLDGAAQPGNVSFVPSSQRPES